jgi:hypothetical protein
MKSIIERRRKSQRVVIGKSQWKRGLGRSRRRWKYNITMNLGGYFLNIQILLKYHSIGFKGGRL